MKHKLILALCLASVSLSLVSLANAKEKEIENSLLTPHTVNLNELSNFLTTEGGIKLNFADGTWYYAEVPNLTKEPEYVYVICDVVDYYGDELCDYAINLVCKMPNGTLHTYVIEDPPEEAELVCFKTDNQDDYATYEVVAVR